MKVLDLCSGLGGWSNTWRKAGHDVTTLDIDPRFGADIVEDVREVQWPRGAFDVILASPPCELFSTAGWHQPAWKMSGDKSKGTNRYRPVKPAAKMAIEIVDAVVQIIEEVRPKAAIIENPRGLLRQLGLIPGTLQTVWYCHYGEIRAKPTDLWTFWGAEDIRFKPECHNRREHHPRNCCCRDHVKAPRGSITGTQGMSTEEAALIPPPLARAVRTQLERKLT
jgi:hypothetical protein